MRIKRKFIIEPNDMKNCTIAITDHWFKPAESERNKLYIVFDVIWDSSDYTGS
jgi:hypothetical protein